MFRFILRACATLLFLSGIATASNCLTTAKNVSLPGSPFPFSNFVLSGKDFMFFTPDRHQNRLICSTDGAGNVSWSIETGTARNTTIYSYDDILNYQNTGKVVTAYEDEVGDRTIIDFTHSSGKRGVNIKRNNHSTGIQLTCEKGPNGLQTISAEITNNRGAALGTVPSAINLANPAPPRDPLQAQVDLNGSALITPQTFGCGGVKKPTEKPANSET